MKIIFGSKEIEEMVGIYLAEKDLPCPTQVKLLVDTAGEPGERFFIECIYEDKQ